MMPLTQSYGEMRQPRQEASCPHVLKVLHFFIFCGSTLKCLSQNPIFMCHCVEISCFELPVMCFCFYGFLGPFIGLITAALNLGCKPVRTSRSDRHNNPRTYLSSRIQQPPSVSHKPDAGNPLNYAKVTTPAVSPIPVPDSTHQNSKLMGSSNYPFSEGLPCHRQPLTKEARPSLNLGSVYPLYYGYEAREPQPRTTARDTTCSDTIFVGRPVISVPEPSGIGLSENFSYGTFHHVANRMRKETAVGTQEAAPDRECDLSLRLGQCLHPCSSSKSSSAYEVDDVGLGVSPESCKFSHLSLQRNREFCFYPRETGYGTIESTSGKCNVEGEDLNLEATLRKRKAPLCGNNEEDGQFCRNPGVPSNRFTSRPGS